MNITSPYSCVELVMLLVESDEESSLNNIMLLCASDRGVAGARLFHMRGRGCGSMTDMSTCVVVDTAAEAFVVPFVLLAATPIGGFAFVCAILRILV